MIIAADVISFTVVIIAAVMVIEVRQQHQQLPLLQLQCIDKQRRHNAVKATVTFAAAAVKKLLLQVCSHMLQVELADINISVCAVVKAEVMSERATAVADAFAVVTVVADTTDYALLADAAATDAADTSAVWQRIFVVDAVA